MNDIHPSAEVDSSAWPHRFIANFMMLSLLSGITIGMGKVITTLYALHLGATSLQLGFIAGAESLGRMVVTLPAGFLIFRYGARTIYSLASLGPMLLNLLMPWTTVWYGLALVRGLTSLCVPFRTVSMNSSFLQQLRTLGATKAGWHRGSQSLGMAIFGPLAASFSSTHFSFLTSYILLSACFAFMVFHSRTFLPDSEPDGLESTAAKSGGITAQVKEMLRNVEIADSCLVEFVTTCVTSSYTTFIIVMAMAVAHVSEQQAIGLILMQGVTTVAALFLCGYLLHLTTRRVAQAFSFTATIAGLCILGTGDTLATLAIGTVLVSFGAAFLHLLKMAQLSDLRISKSKISGLYNLVGILGAFFGAVVGGILSSYLGTQFVFLCWIPLILLAVIPAFARR